MLKNIYVKLPFQILIYSIILIGCKWNYLEKTGSSLWNQTFQHPQKSQNEMIITPHNNYEYSTGIQIRLLLSKHRV